MKIPFGRPIFSGKEVKRIGEVLKSGVLTHGKLVEEFERRFADFIGTKFAVAVSSCTAGLHLSLMGVGIKPGDEVIVPAMTHTATAHVVEFCGAKPIFVDVCSDTGNIDIMQIKRKLSRRTRAILVVHFLGLPCEMEEINYLAKIKKLVVIEDCALSLGAEYKGVKAGSLGKSGCFSFYPIKHITTAEGGMLTTNDRNLARQASKQRAFGIDKSIQERKISGIYDVKYLGNNYRMSEIQAVLGLSQMDAFTAMNKKRISNADRLRKSLKNISTIEIFQNKIPGCVISANYCLNIIINEDCVLTRDQAAVQLNNRRVGTSIYYGCPVPLMSYYRQKYGYRSGDFPIAEFISNNSIALAVGPHLNGDEIDYISKCVKEICKKGKKRR